MEPKLLTICALVFTWAQAIHTTLPPQSLFTPVIKEAAVFLNQGKLLPSYADWDIFTQIHPCIFTRHIDSITDTVRSARGSIQRTKQTLNLYGKSVPVLPKLIAVEEEHANDAMRHLSKTKKNVKKLFELKTNRKVKRGLFNAAGRFLKWGLGVATEADVTRLEKLVAHKEEKVATLTKIAQRELKLFNQSKEILASHTRELTSLESAVQHLSTSSLSIARLTNQTQYLYLIDHFSRIRFVLSTAMERANQVVDHASSIMDALLSGKCGPSILSPEHLETLIISLKSELPTGLTILAPGTSVLSIYEMAISHTITHENALWIQISIPIFSVLTVFDLFRVIGFPLAFEDSTFTVGHELRSEYLAIEQDRSQFFELTKLEMRECSRLSHPKICRLQKPIHKSFDNACLPSLFLNKTVPKCQTTLRQEEVNSFLRVGPEHWIYSMSRKTALAIICPEKNAIKTRDTTIKGTGLLIIPSTCSATTKDFIIPSSVRVTSHDTPNTDRAFLHYKTSANLSTLLINKFPALEKVSRTLTEVIAKSLNTTASKQLKLEELESAIQTLVAEEGHGDFLEFVKQPEVLIPSTSMIIIGIGGLLICMICRRTRRQQRRRHNSEGDPTPQC
jgi:hypothetical protein